MRISMVRASMSRKVAYESTISFFAFASSSRHTCISGLNMMGESSQSGVLCASGFPDDFQKRNRLRSAAPCYHPPPQRPWRC